MTTKVRERVGAPPTPHWLRLLVKKTKRHTAEKTNARGVENPAHNDQFELFFIMDNVQKWKN